MAEVPVVEAETPASVVAEASSEESGNTATADESGKGLSFTHLLLVLHSASWPNDLMGNFYLLYTKCSGHFTSSSEAAERRNRGGNDGLQECSLGERRRYDQSSGVPPQEGTSERR